MGGGQVGPLLAGRNELRENQRDPVLHHPASRSAGVVDVEPALHPGMALRDAAWLGTAGTVSLHWGNVRSNGQPPPFKRATNLNNATNGRQIDRPNGRRAGWFACCSI